MTEDYGNDEDYWQRAWESHENDKAIVDVDIRGWLYTPHRGPMTRRHRLYIGVARQIIGLPAPPASKSSDSSADPSRESSPARPQGHEEDLINLEAEHLVEHGNEEAKKAQQGAHHELSNNKGIGNRSLYSANSRSSSPERGRYPNASSRLSQMSTASQDDLNITPLQKRSSWQLPAKMSSAELSVANGHLLTRLKPFLSNPLAESPISAFFYNESVSRQRTVYTDSSGHFTCRAPLDFVPTHVRILAGEGLSATEEVNITPERGVSMISDIDDTIKHSGITAGARDIFRNAFIRELGDLTVDGVREWYNAMADMGVKLHYVSNSPWQMYPVLASYFKIAHLPKGSFHLKQYSGALQGIFEPVAERKKSTLNKLMHDFPNRKFILVGDSGEADLEVYTDVVLDNPGRILGVFIRDVTTKPPQTGYFDSSSGPPSSGKPSSRNHSRNQSGDSLAMSKRLSRPGDIREDDQDLKAAIAASLQDMEEETRRARRSINPDTPTYSQFFNDGRKDRPPLPARIATSPGSSANHHAGSPEEDLIDFSDPVPSKPWLRPSPSGSNLAARRASNLAEPHKHTPSPPPKPQSLRSPSDSKPIPIQSESSKPAPPRPRKPSSTVKPPSPQPPHQPLPANPSPLSQVTRQDSTAKARPPLPARTETTGHRSLAHPKHGTNSIQSPAYWQSDQRTPTASQPSVQLHDKAGPPPSSKLGAPPALPPPRRKGSAQSLTPSTRTLPSNPPNQPTGSSNYAPQPPSRMAGTWTEDGGLAASPGDGLSKKEALWNQRWSRAKGILERQGVTVRSWRVGGDVKDVCGKLVEFGRREVEKESKEVEAKKRREGNEGAQ